MAKPSGLGSPQKDVALGAKNTLKGVTLLEGQTASVVKRWEGICRWNSYSEGETVIDRSDTGRDVFFIVKGQVRAVDYSTGGQEVAFVDLGAGEHFGELSAIDGEARSTMVYALEDSVLAMVPGKKFVNLIHKTPKVALRLMKHLVSTIRTLNGRVVELSSTTAAQRIYSELLRMSTPVRLNPRRAFIDNMPQHKDIAMWVGTTPETVARAIGRLLQTNVVKRRHKTLHILDRERLKELAGGS